MINFTRSHNYLSQNSSNHTDYGILDRFQTTMDVDQNETKTIRYRPSARDFNETWGDFVEKESIKKYLLLDATSEEDRRTIAQMNGVEEDWVKKNGEYDKSTYVQQKCYDLLHLVAKNNKRPFMCGHIEGWHRTGAVISLMTGKRIDPTTGVLSNALTFDDLISCIDTEKEKDIDKTVEGFADFLHNKLTGSVGHDKCEFVYKTSIMEVHYINVPSGKVDLDVILERLRAHSRAISDSKRGSACKSTAHMIAGLLKGVAGPGGNLDYEGSPIDDDSCIYSPSINISWAPRRKIGKKVLDNILENAESLAKGDLAEKDKDSVSKDSIEMRAFTLPGKLFSTAFVNYCKDPFDEKVSEKMKQEFTFKTCQDESVTISPPFLNTFQSMTMDPGKVGMKAMTTWMVNTAWYLPRIVHILYSSKNNKPLRSVGQDKAVHEICMYTIRYHGNAVGLINYHVDPILQKHYNSNQYSANTNSINLNVIAAALFICDTINIMLIHPDEFNNNVPDDKEKDEDKIKRVKDSIKTTASEVGLSLTSINTQKNQNLYSTNDIIHALGRFISCIILLVCNFYLRHHLLTNIC